MAAAPNEPRLRPIPDFLDPTVWPTPSCIPEKSMTKDEFVAAVYAANQRPEPYAVGHLNHGRPAPLGTIGKKDEAPYVVDWRSIKSSDARRSEYGESLDWHAGNLTDGERLQRLQWAKELMIERAGKLLPAGSRFEIRLKASNYGGTSGVAWYASKAMQDDPRWYAVDNEYPVVAFTLDYFTFGRFCVPA